MGDAAVKRAGNRGLAGAREIGRVPRVALTRAEAASALGISVDSFERYVQPEIRHIRRGRLRLVPVRELERWLDSNAARVLEEDS
jgi:excisionase family DNA binding protein